MSELNYLWQLFFFYSVISAIGLSAVDVIPLSATARWFVRRRGIMTGIVKVGTGAGQFIIPLVASFFIANYGWRTSYIIIGATAMVLLILTGQLLRRNPEEMGFLPDGDKKLDTQSSGFIENGFYVREALGTRQFWIICFTFLTTMFCLITIMTHIVPHATDIGISATVAAGILSTIGGISMAGRFVTGIAIDRIGNKKSIILCLILLILALLWLQLAKELWMLYLFAVVYGVSHGGLFTALSPTVAEYFGVRSHGVLFGIVFCSAMIGGAIGPVLTGYIFDTTGNYNPAFWVCTSVGALALILVLTIRKTRLHR